MNYQRYYDWVCNHLDMGTGENGREETEVAKEFWSGLLEYAKKGSKEQGFWNAVLMEEALYWRVISFRLMRRVGEEPLVVSKSERAPATMDKMNPSIDGLAKAQERFRKVMKELMERLSAGQESGPVSLASLMQPIIEQAGDVLDDAIEYERNKSAARRAGNERGEDGGVARDVQPS